jgi:hypothetical protein
MVLRAAHSFVRALAIVNGDYPGANIKNIPQDRWTGFKLCFGGVNKYKEHSDLWLPTAIGLFELAIYPILICLGYYGVLGGWIGIKTAGSWMGYTKSRTSFNRFLLFNILTILIACPMSLFVERLKC